MRCTAHRVTNCGHSACRRERDRRNETTDTSSDLTNPASPLYQAAFGDSYSSSGPSSSSCDTSSSSSSYDGGSSSSPYDSGSSSSSDCGSY